MRTTSSRLAEQRQISMLLGGVAVVLALICVGQAVALTGRPAQAAEVQFTPAPARTAYAKCGAYDVFVVGHDFPSTDDARKAAFSYLQEGCEVGRGLPPKD